jgi:thiol-disulfide isomerase/thioredoxin
MSRTAAALILLALGAFLPAAPQPGREVRICRSLEEAAPPQGRPVLLVFFSTECPSCYDDLFEARYTIEKGGWPVRVVGVYAGPEDELRSFLEKYTWTLPVVLDRRKILFRKFNVDSLPDKTLLAGGTTLYRDDPYQGPTRRMEELKACLRKMFSR